MHLLINDLARPIAVEGAMDVIALLEQITVGWTIRRTDGGEPPCLRLRRLADRWAIEGAARGHTLREPTALSAACSLVVDLAEALADERPDMLALHAGAVRLGGGLVVLPSRRRAGKSTLIARLASLGAAVFADDILPLVTRAGTLEARALGVASRLRLPLPASLPEAFLQYCAAEAGPGDRYYRYLRPGSGRLAPYGRAAPVKAFVFLDRGPDDAAATLHPAPKGAALEALLLQNFGLAASAGEILDRLVRLTEQAPAFVLRYGSLDPAAGLLLDAFARGLPAPTLLGREALLPLPPERRSRRPPCRLAGPLVCKPGIAVRPVHGRPFVTDDQGGAILKADGVAGLILELLEEPVTAAEISDALAAAFTETAPETIRADVERFLADLAAHRLLEPATGVQP